MPLRAPKFGQFLAQARRASLGKRASYAQVAEKIRERGITTVSASAIFKLENEGRVPEVITLIAISDAYGLAPDKVFNQLVHELLRLTPPAERIDVKSLDEARALREREEVLVKGLRRIAAAAAHLLGDSTHHAPARAVGEDQPGRRRRHRGDRG